LALLDAIRWAAFAVAAFSNNTRLIQPFTRSKEALVAGIGAAFEPMLAYHDGTALAWLEVLRDQKNAVSEDSGRHIQHLA